MTTEQLQQLLGTPLALLGLMYLASISSGLKQILAARKDGSTVSCHDYFVRYWPETVAMVLANLIAFVVLVLTDQLNYASALGIGYGANSVADLLRSGGRSSALSPTSTETKTP